jgi:hypothetical protein
MDVGVAEVSDDEDQIREPLEHGHELRWGALFHSGVVEALGGAAAMGDHRHPGVRGERQQRRIARVPGEAEVERRMDLHRAHRSGANSVLPASHAERDRAVDGTPPVRYKDEESLSGCSVSMEC